MIFGHHLFREFGQTSFYVPACGIRVSGEDVSPVSLTVHQQILLSDLDQCPENGRVAVRVKLHRFPDYGGHFRVCPVIYLEHGMKHTALDRLQSIVNVRDGPLENDV